MKALISRSTAGGAAMMISLIVTAFVIPVYSQEKMERPVEAKAESRLKERGAEAAWTLPRVLMEIEAAMSESAAMEDGLSTIRIRSRACDLLWPYRTQATKRILREMLADLEHSRLARGDEAAARQAILAVLLKREPESVGAEVKASPELLRQIAGDLLDSAPDVAGKLIKETLPQNPTREGISMLSQLRSSNPVMADGIALDTVNALPSMESLRALNAANTLGFYLFPNGAAVGGNATPELARSFFVSGLEVLRSSVVNTQPATVFAAHQTMLLRTLVALMPGAGPEKVQELNRLADQIEAGGRNGPFAAVQAAEADRVDLPQFSAFRSLRNGDLDQARTDAMRLGDPAFRDTILDLASQKEFEEAVQRRDFDAAFNAAAVIRGVEPRLKAFAKLARLSEQDPKGIPTACIDEIQRMLMTATDEKLEPASLTAVIDVFAVDPDAGMSLTRTVVLRLNASSKAKRSAEDKRSIETGLQQLFRTAGAINLGLALGTASLIENRYYSLLARLSACEQHLK